MYFTIEKGNILIVNGDENLTFTFKYYLKGNKMSDRIFVPINRYLKTLEKGDDDQLFEIYKRIHVVFYKDDYEIRYSDDNVQEVISLLQNTIGDLYGRIDYDGLKQWCSSHGNFYYQTTLKEDYGTNRPETTYLKSHYGGLLFLSTLLKFVAPIWGVFISEFDKAIGKDFKETVALSLLNKTKILELEEFSKLKDLVDSMADKAVNTINAIFGNLGTVDLPDWALATVTVRKVAVAEVDNESVKLISIIYSHLSNLNKRNSLEDRGDSTRLKERKAPDEDGGGDDENRASVLEKYKLRQEHPDHVPIIDEIYLNNVKKAIKDIDPTVPISKEPYKSYIKNFHKLSFSKLEITDFHIRICSCIVRKPLACRNLENIQFLPFLKLLLISQILLHHWGFNVLANLLVAEVEETANDVLKDNSFVALPQEVQEEISNLYPYYKNNNKTTSLNRKPTDNAGMLFINDMVTHINRNTWYYANDYLADRSGYVGTMISIPVDMKQHIANLLIKTMVEDNEERFGVKYETKILEAHELIKMQLK